MPEIVHIPDDESGSDFESVEDLLGEVSGIMRRPVLSPTQYMPSMRSNLPTSAEKPPQSSTSSIPADICVMCNDAPEYNDGANIFATCGLACASELQEASGLSIRNKPRTSDPPNRAFISSAPPNIFDNDWESPSQPSGRKYTDIARSHARPNQDASDLPIPNKARTSDSSMPTEMCVICNDAPVYRDGPDISATCGMACASKLQAVRVGDLPIPNNFRTSDPPNRTSISSALPNFSDNNWESPSQPSGRNYADITRSHSRPNQIKMCDVCHVRPRYERGGKIYPTCGLSCAAKLRVPGSVEMCDYCKKRPKVVIYGKKYPQCGKTCRDKAKLAETAANAALCKSCILCWKLTKSGESDFCSEACENLADIRAPFLIEIPRGHVAFKKVADVFTSEWQTSKTPCPTMKRVYMVAMKKSFKTSFEKYKTKTGLNILQRKRTPSKRWLALSRECGFGDPGDLEPCSSNKCLLCSIVRSSFSRSDFPGGITTSRLNRTVELYQSGKKSSSKIAALADVVVGREAEMSPHDVHVVHPLPPQNTDSVHIIGARNGSRVDWGDIIVYNGDAVRPLYLISYE